MLEIIREEEFADQKVVVASSQAVYSEGAGDCPKHGLVFPNVRPIEQLRTRRLGGALPNLRCGDHTARQRRKMRRSAAKRFMA